MLRIPPPDEEDMKRLCRERGMLIGDRDGNVSRINRLLFSRGILDYQPLAADRRARLDGLRSDEGQDLPKHVTDEVRRELDRLELVLEHIKAIETERDALIAAQPADAPVKRLLRLKGVDTEAVAVLWGEGLLSRHFENRRQVEAFAGLSPGQSVLADGGKGGLKSGNPRLRETLFRMAWLWLRHQPDSALAQWFRARAEADDGDGKKSDMVGALEICEQRRRHRRRDLQVFLIRLRSGRSPGREAKRRKVSFRSFALRHRVASATFQKCHRW